MCFGSEEYLQIKHLREQSTKSRAVIIDQDAAERGKVVLSRVEQVNKTGGAANE